MEAKRYGFGMFDPHNDQHRVDTLKDLRIPYRNADALTIGKERTQLDQATTAVLRAQSGVPSLP